MLCVKRHLTADCPALVVYLKRLQGGGVSVWPGHNDVAGLQFAEMLPSHGIGQFQLILALQNFRHLAGGGVGQRPQAQIVLVLVH